MRKEGGKELANCSGGPATQHRHRASGTSVGLGHPRLPLRDRGHPRRQRRAGMEKQSNAERRAAGGSRRNRRATPELINQSEGERQGAINAAQGQAESMRLKATSEEKRTRSRPSPRPKPPRRGWRQSDGRRLGRSPGRERGGRQGRDGQTADKYVSELAEMAKQRTCHRA